MSTITNTVRWSTNVDELKRNLAQGLDQIEATRAGAEKLVQSLGGDKLIAAAHRYAAAVQEMGGAARLTTAEQERVNAVVQKAIDKYTALGQTAPTALRDLADATKTNAEHWKSFTDGFNVKEAIESPLGAAKQAMSAFSAELGATAVAGLGVVSAIAAIGVAEFELASKAAATGAQLNDMSEKTGLSVPALSRLSKAMTVAGGDMSQMTSAIFMFEERLGKGGEEFARGLQRIGLSVDEVKKAGPDQWLQLIAERFATIHDPSARAAAAMELFGKQGREIIPTLSKLNEALEMTADTKPWSEEQAKAAEEFEMKVRKLQLQFSSLAATIGKDLIPVLNAPLDLSIGTLAWFLTQAKTQGPLADIEHQIALVRALGAVLRGVEMPKPPAAPGVPDQAKTAEAARQAMEAQLIDQQLLEGHLTKLRAAYDALTPAQARLAAEMLKGGDNAQAVATWLHVDTRAVNDLVDAQKEAERQAKKDEAAAKKHAEALEHLRVTMGGYATALEDVGAPLAALIQADLKHGGSVADLAEKYGVAQVTVEQLDKQLKFTESVTEATTKAFHNQLAMLTPLTERFGNLHDALHTLAGSWNEFHDGITVAGDEMSTVTIPMFSTLPNVVAKNTALIKEATAANRNWGDTLTDTMKDVPNLLAAAFTGGGGIGGAAKALGTKVTAGLFGEKGAFSGLTSAATGGLQHVFGDTIGKALGAAIPGIGALIMPGLQAMWGGIKKLFGGPSAEELKGRETIQAFEKQISSTLTATQKLEAGNETWKQTTIAVRDAYLATGRSEAEAEAAVKRLWDSSKKGAAETQAAIDAVNSVLNEQKQDQQDLEAAIQRYGFSIEQLGPAMQKQKLDDQAKQLLNDWRLLVGSGIAVADVDAKMASSIHDYLKLARQTGQEVPAAMKPILQTMIDNGQLTDDAGHAITDMGQLGVTWSESMTQGFDRVVDKLQQLLEGLGLVPKALDAIPSQKDITVTPHMGGPSEEGGIVGPEPVARGGLVRAFGIQHFDFGGLVKASGWRAPWSVAPIGTDTVPAMLTPGELILNQPQQTKLTDLLEAGAAAAHGLLGGGKAAPVVLQEQFQFDFTINTIDGRDLQETVETKLMPSIVSVIEDRRRGYAARLQQALGTA